MLTIKDLSASKELDRAAMATVRGGTHAVPSVPSVPSTLKIINKPEFDLSSDLVTQYQGSVIDQSYNEGGINLAGNFQNQYATA
jgi:hypothetical protein